MPDIIPSVNKIMNVNFLLKIASHTPPCKGNEPQPTNPRRSTSSTRETISYQQKGKMQHQPLYTKHSHGPRTK